MLDPTALFAFPGSSSLQAGPAPANATSPVGLPDLTTFSADLLVCFAQMLAGLTGVQPAPLENTVPPADAAPSVEPEKTVQATPDGTSVAALGLCLFQATPLVTADKPCPSADVPSRTDGPVVSLATIAPFCFGRLWQESPAATSALPLPRFTPVSSSSPTPAMQEVPAADAPVPALQMPQDTGAALPRAPDRVASATSADVPAIASAPCLDSSAGGSEKAPLAGHAETPTQTPPNTVITTTASGDASSAPARASTKLAAPERDVFVGICEVRERSAEVPVEKNTPRPQLESVDTLFQVVTERAGSPSRIEVLSLPQDPSSFVAEMALPRKKSDPTDAVEWAPPAAAAAHDRNTAPPTLAEHARPLKVESVREILLAHVPQVKDQGPVHLRFHLDPPGLGSLEVKLSAHQERVTAQFVVGQEKTAEIIHGLAPVLRDKAESLGMVLERMDVAADGGQGRQPAQDYEPPLPAWSQEDRGKGGLFAPPKTSVAGSLAKTTIDVIV